MKWSSRTAESLNKARPCNGIGEGAASVVVKPLGLKSHGEKLGLGMIWRSESLKRTQERLLVQLCSGAGLSLCPVGGRVGDEELSTPFEAQRMRSGPQVSNTELFTPLN